MPVGDLEFDDHDPDTSAINVCSCNTSIQLKSVIRNQRYHCYYPVA